ncbi:MAG: hypothetical protein GY742_15860 [Hyphomicrobiales bacterium]|nr:hypothetical protein [Hyphomicrobiales bacterium]
MNYLTRGLAFSIAIFLNFAAFTPANAIVVNATTTLDLDAISLDWDLTSLDSPVTVNQSDTLDVTVNFANNRSIRVNQNGGFRFWLNDVSVSSDFTIENITLTLFDLVTNGSFVNGSNQGTQSSGIAHIGWNSNAANLGITALGSFIQFSGYNISYDVTSLSAGTVTYGNHWLISSNASVVDTPAVPIPPALALFGSGLAILGFFGWRRKRKTVSIA